MREDAPSIGASFSVTIKVFNFSIRNVIATIKINL